ncbi:DNA polymerase III subunit chi [Sphingomonas sp.]|uniref:DNA polymerase III subunit chi n=1 Tax=Sphingomonas sp. TaxID=28214 RepID=UPI00260B1E66|nr:DNA polymerase III subunit chi [Sphingomonas sp.]
MQVDFYHLTSMPLERALPRIAERVLESGARLLIVAGDQTQQAAIDRFLWEYSADSFLPHACAGAADENDQPVLIALDVNAANGARHVALVDGTWREDALDFQRAFHFFDEEHIVEARHAWRTLNERECVERRYWKQNEAGRWEQAA